MIKFKNQSYLHTKWMKPEDISSAGKSAKTMLNRWHKKLVGGKEDPDQLEDPTIELGWVEAERVIGKKIRDEWIEMTETEMKEYEAAQAAEEEEEDEEEGDDEDDEAEKLMKKMIEQSENTRVERIAKKIKDPFHPSNTAEEVDPVMKEVKEAIYSKAPYIKYPSTCGNPYAEGFISGPPKRPRTAYAFYQLLDPSGDEAKWETMVEEEKRVYQKLNEEESSLYELHVGMHDKAQNNVTSVWQPIRRCLAVLDRICEEGFSDIFREPVDTEYFTDYLDVIQVPMDLRTVRQKMDDNKYKLPEDFARDCRKIWKNCKVRGGGGIIAKRLSRRGEAFNPSAYSINTIPFPPPPLPPFPPPPPPPRSTTSMAPPYGTSPTTWRRSSSVSSTPGSCPTRRRKTFTGSTTSPGPGRTRAGSQGRRTPSDMSSAITARPSAA